MYEIREGRVVAGVLVGVSAAVIGVSSNTGAAWPIFTVVGSICAALAAILAVWPAYLLLKRRGGLKIWWAVLLGAALVPLPDLLITLNGLIPNGSTTSIFAHGAQLVEDSTLTPEGWFHFFVRRPSYFIPFGVVGGFLGWIVAFGFCIEPRKHVSNNVQPNEGA